MGILHPALGEGTNQDDQSHPYCLPGRIRTRIRPWTRIRCRIPWTRIRRTRIRPWTRICRPRIPWTRICRTRIPWTRIQSVRQEGAEAEPEADADAYYLGGYR